jgi:hypothetical protein
MLQRRFEMARQYSGTSSFSRRVLRWFRCVKPFFDGQIVHLKEAFLDGQNVAGNTGEFKSTAEGSALDHRLE